MKPSIIIDLLWIVGLSIVIGIMIPVTSPVDKLVQEKQQEQVKHKAPVRVAPIPPSKVLIDLNEDEIPEWYYVIPTLDNEDKGINYEQ